MLKQRHQWLTDFREIWQQAWFLGDVSSSNTPKEINGLESSAIQQFWMPVDVVFVELVLYA